jgi:demethylmenaquinone methyltransferase/2-methoxy-6-polyprenyl-1,4-benzoquinol methylase
MPPALKNDPVALRDPDAKREYNRRLFAEVAPRYFAATRLLSLFRDKAWKRCLLARLASAAPAVVLDVASGTGDLALAALRQWPGSLVIGCDLSLAMMAFVNHDARGAEVELTCQDMTALSIASHKVDLVLGGYALRNAPDLPAMLAESFRVLSPGGQAAFIDFARSPHPAVFFAQYWVLRLWGGFWGLVLHGNPAVYAYIAESLRFFPHRRALREMLAAAGYRDIVFIRRMAGLVDLVFARTPLLPDSIPSGQQ